MEDIQDLLSDLLGENSDDDAFVPEDIHQAHAVNQAEGDVGEAVMSDPGAFINTEDEVHQDDIEDVEDFLAEIPDSEDTADEADDDDPLSLLEEALGMPAEESNDDEDVAGEIELPLQSAAKQSEQLFTDVVVPESRLEIPTFTDDEIADTIDIRNLATLVTLQTARWHAKVKDRQAARDAADANGADARAFEATKNVLVGADEKLKRVHKAIDAARAEHYRLTMPWSTVNGQDGGKRTGGRLLPNTLFMDYTTAMAHAKQEMQDALADFIPAYPSMIQTAQSKLGKRFDPNDYPHPSIISSHFRLSFDFTPVPIGEDFKGLSDSMVEALSDKLNQKNRLMLENAVSDVWVELLELVAHVHEKLTVPDAVFHYTLVDKLRDQSNLLKHLNVLKDTRIEEVRAFIEKHLTMHDAKDIRKDEHLRKQLAQYAGEALTMMKDAV